MQIQCTLAGANFRPSEARERCKQLQIGEQLTLEPDPDNQYDSSAVRVLTNDGHFIGFVPKSDNGPVFDNLNRGEPVECEVVGFQSSIKPILEITFE